MKFDEWIQSLPFKHNPKGLRLDLRLYIYPDGHGNLFTLTEDGGEHGNQPVNNLDEAENALRRVWRRGVELGTERARSQ
jgi:hypothetical protein